MPAEPDVHARVLDDHTAEVEWVPAPKGGMPGVGFYINYTIAGSDQWHQSASVLMPNKKLNLTNLRRDTLYYVSVVM